MKHAIKNLSLLCVWYLAGCGGSDPDINEAPEITTSPSSSPVSTPASSNSQPIARITGVNESVLGTMVSLSGSQSTDADNDPLVYVWRLVTTPSDSNLMLTTGNSDVAFIPDAAGQYQVELIVNDGQVDSEAVVHNLLVRAASAEANTAPIAVITGVSAANIDSHISLSASHSSDHEGDELSYQWRLLTKPDTSKTQLLVDNLVQTSLTVDRIGDYQVELMVNDGSVNSARAIHTLVVGRDSLDITNAEFSLTDSNCEQYLGSYISKVMDIKRDIGFTGSVVVTKTLQGCALQSNEIPNHNFNDASAAFAQNVSMQSLQVELNQPQLAVKPTEMEFGVTNAVFLNGVVLDMFAAACYGIGSDPLGREKIGCGGEYMDHPWRYDPLSPLNNFGTDAHNAHVQPGGIYHYHGDPKAMYNLNCEFDLEPSPVIGFAADGFPIFGSCFTDETGTVRKAQSSYQLKDNGGPRQSSNGYAAPVAGVGSIKSNNYDGQFRGDHEFIEGSGDLDRCNGMTVNGQYGYYITEGFPYVLNCFSGTVNSSFKKSMSQLQRALHSH